MRAKKQNNLSNDTVEETKSVSIKMDRPAYFIRDAPFPIQQFHRMKSRQVFTELQKVEWEITEKLQKLKMECFGNDQTGAKTETVLCNSTYEVTKPLRMYYVEIEETSIEFKIPDLPEVFRELWQEELEIIEKLRKLKVNQVRLDQKRKCFSRSATPTSLCCHGAYTSNLLITRHKIEWKLKEIERTKESLYTLYFSGKPFPRKRSDDKGSQNEQITKLRNGRHHGSKNLVEERQHLKKINHIREVEKISGNHPTEPASRIYTWRGDVLDTKKALTDYIKVTSREVQELRMKQMTYKAHADRAQLEKASTDKKIRILERRLDNIEQKKVQAGFQITSLQPTTLV
ncbi:uncharacterized protein LOC141698477 [Apium graveolens]|uniref:uncharacterized protein LOC141698477 n=1 Tax=Apium graveolens TaxID=4045 RepID=UPI003D798D6C